MKYLLVSALFLAFASTSFAGDRKHTRNQHREQKQQHRIQQGVASGELTHREAKKLRAQQHHIDRAQTKAAADGTVDAQEKLKLERMQDRASKNIYDQKHDAQDRGE